jgi:hypothetical protein
MTSASRRWSPARRRTSSETPTRADVHELSNDRAVFADMMSTEDPAANRRAAPFLNCPRCGLSIRPKARWMTIEHCPRCLARARVAVKMFPSPLPAAELYHEGGAPQADKRSAPTTSRTGPNPGATP